MRKRYEIHKGQFTGSYKIQYYIWDTKLKTTMVDIRKGGISTARKIIKLFNTS